MESYEFDVAVSFAGEDRPIVKEVVDTLRERGLTAFYDEDYKVEIWGQDLAVDLMILIHDAPSMPSSSCLADLRPQEAAAWVAAKTAQQAHAVGKQDRTLACPPAWRRLAAIGHVEVTFNKVDQVAPTTSR